jgi:hypothetical protein
MTGKELWMLRYVRRLVSGLNKKKFSVLKLLLYLTTSLIQNISSNM